MHWIFVKPSQLGSSQIAPVLMIAVWPISSLIWNRDASGCPFCRQKASAAGLPQAEPYSRQKSSMTVWPLAATIIGEL